MSKIFFLLTIASFGIVALADCANSTVTTTNTTAQNTAAKANTATSKSDPPASTILKPGDVSADKTVKVIDLVDSVAAAKDGWKGKEVVVTGYVSGTSGSGGKQLLTMINDQTASIKKDISCSLAGVKSDEVFSKTVVVKGKISSINTDGDQKSINLEPCELKK